MNIIQLVKLYLLTAVTFFAIDFVWLAYVAPKFYEKHVGPLLADDVRKVPAVLFYLIYIAGILVFAVLPSLNNGTLGKAIALGAFLGFFAYATFDLTCLALFKHFNWTVVVVDLVWGAFITGSVSAASYGIGRWLGFE